MKKRELSTPPNPVSGALLATLSVGQGRDGIWILYSNGIELLPVHPGSLASAAVVAAFLFPSLQRFFLLLLAGAHYVDEGDGILWLLPLILNRIILHLAPWASRSLPGAE